ncbi:MAG: hypothetical protein JJ913_04725 [Rhizobiaceae bacterium]|nr:hypothetical protein [Rhizobiaceae bacterium]
MNNDPKYRDPLYPVNPGLGDRPYVERPEIHSGSGRASAAIALMLIALFVVGLVVFSSGTDVDPTQTASPGIDRQEETIPPIRQLEPAPETGADDPAAAPAPTEPAPSE